MYLMFFFFFNDTATTEIYTLSLHDALPIFLRLALLRRLRLGFGRLGGIRFRLGLLGRRLLLRFGSVVVLVVDRKSTRLNSSHANISYAVFCLKKKKKIQNKINKTRI